MALADHVTVVLPCLDEEHSLPGVLAAMPDGYRPLVVDNTSTDRHGRGGPSARSDCGGRAPSRVTARRCTRAWSRPRHRSWRYSTRTGRWTRGSFRRSSPNSTAAPIWPSAGAGRYLDCTGRGMPGSGPPRCAGGCDSGTGCRCTISRRCGWRRRDVLIGLGVTDRRSGYPLELLVRAAQAGWRVVERDVAYGPRTGGESKVSGSVRGSIVAALDFWRVMR